MDFLQTWCDDIHYRASQFDTSFSDGELHSKSQGYEQAKHAVIKL